MEALQNSMLGLKAAMEAVLRSASDPHNIEEVADFENPYLGENRLASKPRADIDHLMGNLASYFDYEALPTA